MATKHLKPKEGSAAEEAGESKAEAAKEGDRKLPPSKGPAGKPQKLSQLIASRWAKKG